jgi:predicted nucleic acid-binding protein
MAVLLDASLIVAAADTSDLNHAAAVAWLDRVADPLAVGALSLADADHLLQRGLGPRATLALLESVVAGVVRLVPPTEADLARAATLMNDAAEHRPRLTDAVLIATAERLGIRRVGTFERRPLAVLRMRGGRMLELEP